MTVATQAANVHFSNLISISEEFNISKRIRDSATEILSGQPRMEMNLYELFSAIGKRCIDMGTLRKDQSLRTDFFINSMLMSQSGFALVADGNRRFFTFSFRIRLITPILDEFWNRYRSLNMSQYLYALIRIQNMLEEKKCILSREAINDISKHMKKSAGFVLSSLASPRSGLVFFSDNINTWITRYERIRLL